MKPQDMCESRLMQYDGYEVMRDESSALCVMKVLCVVKFYPVQNRTVRTGTCRTFSNFGV